jgi:hypothetical protein
VQEGLPEDKKIFPESLSSIESLSEISDERADKDYEEKVIDKSKKKISVIF